MSTTKLKKCANPDCRKEFEPWNSMQKVCSPGCAYSYVQNDKKKAQARQERESRQLIKKQKEAIKTTAEHMREAQAAFNAFIRARDEGLPCISCGRTPDDSGLITGSRVDAGHYRSIGSCPELRFEEMNCRSQCVKCNRHLSGNTVEYRIRLIDRIGQKSVDWLEKQHKPKRYRIGDLKEIKARYRAKKRELERERKAA